ncbi:MAG: serine hydrolase domain-containing protein [Candidatus Aminicenantes bacterium]
MKRLLPSPATFMIILGLIFFSLGFADERAEKVDKLFSHWDKSDTPGCALAVVKDGEIIHKKGYGMADLEHQIPITPQSVFYVGSVSKQFVAFCVALLDKQRKLSLDDDVRKYIPELPDYGTPITIRHLIHHTSGLRDYLALEDIAGIPFGYYHQQDVMELMARQRELNFKPGEEYLYSNSGYFLLAVIVERASGRTLRELSEEKIFKPLGMENSRFHDDYAQIIKNRARGYFPAGDGKYKNYISTFDCVGSGGLYTSVEDFFLWDQNFYHHKVGRKELIDLIQTPGKLSTGEELDYAFALKIGKYRGLKTVGHGGALGGYRAGYIRFPQQRFSVICLANLSSFNPIKLCHQVADIYLAGQFTEKAKTEPRSGPGFIELPEKKLKEKAGTYLDRNTGEVRRIFFKDDRLIMKAFGQKFPLGPLSAMKFQVLGSPVEAVIEFEKKSKEKPLLMHLYVQGQKPETFEAVKPVKPTPAQLREYEGEYHSEELEVTFKLALKEGKLYFVHRHAPEPPLLPTLQDRFTVRGFTIRFIRDQRGEISGFKLNAGRVRNLRFVRK